MLFYRAALPLSSRTLTFVSGLIRRHRKSIGSCWRKLNPGQQALLVLAYLRKGETFAELAAGFGVGTTTAWRYANETVDLLAARAPKLRQAVRDRGRGYQRVAADSGIRFLNRYKHQIGALFLLLIYLPSRTIFIYRPKQLRVRHWANIVFG
jgi:hypothetical protein